MQWPKKSAILASIIPAIFCCVLVWMNLQMLRSSRQHRQRMEAFEERRALAAEAALAEQREVQARRDQMKADHEAKIEALVPDLDDGSVYSHAHGLLFPEYDEQKNSEVAVRLLLRNRELADLPPRELHLLFRAYNNLGQRSKELEAAQTLWENAPGTAKALSSISTALLNDMVSSKKGAGEVVKFVDSEIARGNGGQRELLMLKAEALVRSPKIESRLKQKQLVADTLIESMNYPPVHDPALPMFVQREGLTVFLEMQINELFTYEEREDLRKQMKVASEKRRSNEL